jgi:hypothetical protein
MSTGRARGGFLGPALRLQQDPASSRRSPKRPRFVRVRGYVSAARWEQMPSARCRVSKSKPGAWQVARNKSADASVGARLGLPASCSYARARTTGLVATGLQYKSGFVPCFPLLPIGSRARYRRRFPKRGVAKAGRRFLERRRQSGAAIAFIGNAAKNKKCDCPAAGEAAANTNFFCAGQFCARLCRPTAPLLDKPGRASSGTPRSHAHGF